MSGERRSIAVTFGVQVLQIVVGVATSTLIGRTLGPEAYGVVNVLRNAFVLALTLTPLGLDIALLKFLGASAEEPTIKRAVVRRLRLVALSASCGLWLLTAIMAAMGSLGRLYPMPHMNALTVIAMAGLPFATDAAVLGAVYRAEQRAERFAWRNVGLPSLFRLVAVPAALALAPSVELIVAIGAAQAVFGAIALWRDLDGGRRIASQAPIGVIGSVLAESLWMASSVFVSALMRTVDVLVIGALAPAREVGAYAAVAMVSQLITVFPMAASQSLGPRVAHAYASRTPGAVRRELNLYLDTAAPISAFLFGGIVAFAPELDLIFGPRYVFDPLVCFLVPLGQLLSAGLGPMGFALSMTGRHRAENAILLAGGAGLVLGCVEAAPMFGARGVAACVVCTFALVNLARFVSAANAHGGVPGHWRHLAAAPFALALGYVCAGLVTYWGGRTLSAAIIGCMAYTVLFASLFWLAASSRRLRRLAKIGLVS